MMVFFLDADARVYARYGGRDAVNADNRQSLAGLRATMQSVLAMHQRAEKEFAPKSGDSPKYIREMANVRAKGCLHCHQVKEALHTTLQKAGKFTNDAVWRYPLPDNLGLVFDVDAAKVLKNVKDDSPAAKAGIKPGDRVQKLNGVPIHSFGDAQYALDRAPKTGTIDVTWQRGEQGQSGKLELYENWRKGDVSWRASLRFLIPSTRLYGTDLTAEEKKAIGLAPARLAFRQKESMPYQAKAAGILGGDVILGVDGKALEMNVDGFLRHVESNYLIGDSVTVNLIRDGKRQDVVMKLIP